jgi:radical SAM superfamily enzyme YgiQ (UPF0313 family)
MIGKVTLIALPLSGQRLDPFGSIPAMPTALPPLAAWLRRLGARVQVVDGFAEAPARRWSPAPGVVARGLAPAEIARRVDRDADLVALSVHSVASDTVARATLAELRRLRPGARVVVGGAHPSLLPDRFLGAGADWVVRGEGERGLEALLGGARPPGVIDATIIEDLDSLPTPDFGALPLAAYWRLGLGHGPVRGPYLNVSTSRGCGQGCRFCATPALARGRWRALSPERTVALFEELSARLGVNEFHVEDDDFSADRRRVERICERLLATGRRYRLALPSGVRAQALDAATVRLMAAAGFRYLSLAPESGAGRVLRAMGKDVDLDHLAAIAAEAVRCGMRVGCFLIVGYPGERPADRRDTARLVETLVRLGVDDLSVFVWSPLPGAAAFDLERGWDRFEQLCWTPRWRAGYGRLEGARVGLYLRAFSAMVRSRPRAVIESLARVGSGRFETKGEMTVARMLRWRA